MSTTFAPAETLRQHRPLLLAMEAIGWFHMAGKARAEFLRRHGGENNTMTNADGIGRRHRLSPGMTCWGGSNNVTAAATSPKLGPTLLPSLLKSMPSEIRAS